MEISDIITLIFSFCLVLFAALLWIATRKATIHRALLDMRKEYATKEMKKSVDNLWKFYKGLCEGTTKISKQTDDKAETNLRKHYNSILKGKNLSEELKIYEYLDDHRRRVFHFYHNMIDVYSYNIIGYHKFPWTKKLLFEYWSESTLRIIPKILIPLYEERASFDDYNKIERDRAIKKFKGFYRDAEDYPKDC